MALGLPDCGWHQRLGWNILHMLCVQQTPVMVVPCFWVLLVEVCQISIKWYYCRQVYRCSNGLPTDSAYWECRDVKQKGAERGLVP